MIELDGSYGEGGGQILRTAISLSALTMKPVRISRIRAGRPKPGLKNQHMGGIELTAKLVDAEVDGLQVGSTEVAFVPNQRRGGDFGLDVGTAGSISLLLQAALLPAVLAPQPVTFRLRGGTDVKWSPPVDYLREVFVPMISRLGPSIQIHQERRGHYPRGGGQVLCKVQPVQQLRTIELVQAGKVIDVLGISHCVRLPAHVAERQAASAAEIIQDKLGVAANIHSESYSKDDDPHLGPGSGIVIWAETESGAILGADRLGEKGERAESVGSRAGIRLVEEVSTGRAIDSHLCDMLVPYLAIAPGKSRIGVTEMTSHLMTNIWTIEQILGVRIDVKGELGKPGELVVNGKELLA
ncbi:MAG: RNA 3'-terminal phosphate cyclase [Candidatus Thorarchaeota archaeon]|nr:RNA 3'-terminal phosphate cyclase [Candidatus Thorarchaeota archaeon]